MKKFLMYVIIVVTCLFLGFTIFYLTQNNENISLAISKDESIYKNKGESVLLDHLITWTKPYDGTTLNIHSADETVVKYDEKTKRFDCVSGGFSAITITPSNTDFGPFVFEFYIGDGSLENPFVIDTATELARIGNDLTLEFTSTANYLLISDIDLKSHNNGEWIPLPEYSGKFDGNGFTIHNLNVATPVSGNGGLFSSVAPSGIVEKITFASVIANGSFDNLGVVAGVNNGTVGKINVLSATLSNTNATGNTGSIVGKNIKNGIPAVVNMCSSRAKITGSGNIGGLVGENNSSLIMNSKVVFSYESTASTAKIGGLVSNNKSNYQDEIYSASAIKNCFVVFDNMVGDVTVAGLVYNNNEATYTGQMLFNIYEGCIYNTTETINSVVSNENLLSVEAKDGMNKLTSDQMLEKSYFEDLGYNFSTVWLINKNENPSINFSGAYEVYRLASVGKEVTSEQMTLLEFLENVRGNLVNNVSTYRITEADKDGYDLHNAEWTTIANSQNQPMIASIVADEGCTTTIKNFSIKGNNTSFFGYLSGNTIIEGITFENVVLDNTTNSSAVVVTGLLNGATLKNVKVKDYTSYKTNANNAGIICAVNNGTIENCKVINSATKEFSVTLSDSLTNAGGIVAINNGIVKDCSVDGIKLCMLGKKEGNIYFGGIVATNNAFVGSCATIYFSTEETTATGSIYGGGIVGFVAGSSSAKVEKCYSYADIKVNPSNANAYVGGVVGYLSGSASLYGSFCDNYKIEANNAGGIVGYAVGTVKVCYAGENVTVAGYKAGGIASYILGTVTDCYVLSTMKSVGSGSVLCGMAYFFGPECYTEHCFANAYFVGEGEYWCESKTEFRIRLSYVKFLYDWARNEYSGPVQNNIVLVNNGAKRQPSSVVLNQYKGWIDCTLEQCNGTSGNYEVFKDVACFDANVWNFTEGFPTLKDVVVATAD